MLVYMIVAGDILAGGGQGYPGLVCDLSGAKTGSWCSDRPLIIIATTILAFAPLCSFKCGAPCALSKPKTLITPCFHTHGEKPYHTPFSHPWRKALSHPVSTPMEKAFEHSSLQQ
jgi:hypothetical protein